VTPDVEISIEGTTKPIASTTVDLIGNGSVDSDIEPATGDYRFTVKRDATNGDLNSTTVLFYAEQHPWGRQCPGASFLFFTGPLARPVVPREPTAS
jgi:hypothetical protein